MNQYSFQLRELFKRTTVNIISKNGSKEEIGVGSGFFITPYLILTAYHVVNGAKFINIYYKDNVYAEYNGYEAEVKNFCEDWDWAILELKREALELLKSKNVDCICAFLAKRFPIRDIDAQSTNRFYTYGFGARKKESDLNGIFQYNGVLLTFNHTTEIKGKLNFCKFKDGENVITNGLSGAPILDQTTGLVCGVITHKTSGRGGLGVPIEKVHSSVEELQQEYHFENIQWPSIMSDEQRKNANYEGPKLPLNWWDNLTDEWKSIFAEDKAFRERYSQGKDDYINGLALMEYLNCSDYKIKKLNPIKNFFHLKEINLQNTYIQDLSLLKYMFALERIDITNTPLKSLNGLEELSNLQYISCKGTNIPSLEIEKFRKEHPNGYRLVIHS